MPGREDLVVRIDDNADQAVRVVGDQVLDVSGAAAGELVTVEAGNTLGHRTLAEAGITAAIEAAIDALIAGAPGALDTLNELAAALNDDASFATTVTNALATKIGVAILDANTILYATADDTPAALAVPASRIVGRKDTGDIGALTAAEVTAILDAAISTMVGVGYGLATGNSDAAMVANQVYWARIQVTGLFLPNRFGMHCVTNSAGNMDFAIANDDGTGLAPGGALLYHSGSFAANLMTNNARYLRTIASPPTLTPGVYWLGACADGTPPTMTLTTSRAGRGLNNMRAKTSGFPIADPPTVNGGLDSCPLMWIERA